MPIDSTMNTTIDMLEEKDVKPSSQDKKPSNNNKRYAKTLRLTSDQLVNRYYFTVDIRRSHANHDCLLRSFLDLTIPVEIAEPQ